MKCTPKTISWQDSEVDPEYLNFHDEVASKSSWPWNSGPHRFSKLLPLQAAAQSALISDSLL